jgi:hypothetical protein
LTLSAPVRIGVFAGVVVIAAVIAFALPPFPQPAWYHDFADKRTLLGVPNFQNVASNLPFLPVGIAALSALKRCAFEDARERRAWAVFFFGVAWVAVGSGWYHLAPSNESLFWDRMPMAVAFGGFTSALLTERLHAGAGRGLLVPLVLASAGTVVYWHLGERRGEGDLRPYFLAQALPGLCIPLLVGLFPARYSRGGDYMLLLVWYVAAKLLETFDAQVFEATGGAVSGHALKHLAAAGGTWQVARMVRLRTPYCERPTTPNPIP